MGLEIKKIILISFTEAGDRLAYELEHKLSCERYSFEKYNRYGGIAFGSGRELMKKVWNESDYIIFIGACGMAVRMIDGLLLGKDKDPGIVVLDTEGRFAISLLSGHLGGANEMAEYIAKLIGAIPVITTATDAGKKFSPDLLAKKNHLYITDLNMAKQVAAAVLAGQRIGIVSDYEWKEMSTEAAGQIVLDNVTACNLKNKSEYTTGIYIGNDEKKLNIMKEKYQKVLQLIPKDIVIGVGCKKNIDTENFEKEILRHLGEQNIEIRRVRELHSIDIKTDEVAIREFGRKYNIPCRFYSAHELRRISGSFTSSAFVEDIIGVDNICERSAVMDGGKLIVKKCAGNGVTFAASKLVEWRIVFV